MFRVAAAVSVAVVALVGSPGVVSAVCWAAPVAAPVADPFREPACAWCPGNRGIEYDTRAGELVRAVATGRVTFAGSIAGTTYLVIKHSNGWRTTYANLESALHADGDVVFRGAAVGRAAGRFHFGVRDGERYLDPAPYLGRLRGLPRLIPVDGTRGYPSPRLRLVCE